jgi:hypothetical protein
VRGFEGGEVSFFSSCWRGGRLSTEKGVATYMLARRQGHEHSGHTAGAHLLVPGLGVDGRGQNQGRNGQRQREAPVPAG